MHLICIQTVVYKKTTVTTQPKNQRPHHTSTHPQNSSAAATTFSCKVTLLTVTPTPALGAFSNALVVLGEAPKLYYTQN